jgi:hypothetical protein
LERLYGLFSCMERAEWLLLMTVTCKLLAMGCGFTMAISPAPFPEVSFPNSCTSTVSATPAPRGVRSCPEVRLEDLQLREGHWVIADLRGKGGHIRTIPVPQWVKEAVDSWTVGAGITSGPLLRSSNKAGRIWSHGFTPKVIWAIVKANAKSCGPLSVAPRDLRRTCARLFHRAGGELDQIQFLLGHVSIQTTERYLGCKQRFHDAVNDHIGLEPDAPS